jgi:hypothetical protein
MGGRRTRKQKGGNFYSFGASDLAGVPSVKAVTNNGASSTGAIPASDISQAGGRRRRGMSAKTMRRTRRKTRKQRGGKKAGLKVSGKKARLMRGGASQYLPAKASAGFVGTGERGLANAVDVGTPIPNGVVSA